MKHLDAVKLDDRSRRYDITLIHAEDDYDIPVVHSDVLFWHGVNATMDPGVSVTFEELEGRKRGERIALGDGGWEVEWWGKGGVLREQVVRYGLHDRVMSYPVVSLAVARAFHGQEGK